MQTTFLGYFWECIPMCILTHRSAILVVEAVVGNKFKSWQEINNL